MKQKMSTSQWISLVGIDMKVCSGCKKEKSRDSFYKKSSTKCGLTSACKVCISPRQKEYDSREDNKLLAAKRQRDNRDKINTRRRATNRNPEAAKRRASKLNATPSWADQDIIKEFYQEAAYHQGHIDHIVPLQHKLVCGLHVEHNLQLLSPTENFSKSNNFKVG